VGVVPWLALGLAAALGDSVGDVVTKRYFAHLPPYGMALARLLGAIPFLALAALWLTLPPLASPFWLIVAAMLPLETAAMLLYMRAFRVCHVSLCIPFLAFTPVFLILTGWLILGESLSRGGIVGTVMIASGSYILGFGLDRGVRPGLLAPLKALVREGGAKMMLVVAAIYSVNAALYKAAILHSAPSFFGVAYPLLFTGFMGAGYPWFRVRLRPTLEAHWGWWLAIGFCFALSCLCLANGMEQAPAAYLVAVKRLSLLLTVLLGGLWLQERPILPRILGAILMCSGVAVIALTH